MFDYITRCQSVLQSGFSDNEILVYWPFHDALGGGPAGELLLQLGIDNKDEWLVGTDFHTLVTGLMERGYSVDFISDAYLARSIVDRGKVKTPGASYRALVVPDCRHMPVNTMEQLIRLGKEGGKVIFHGLPETVPGYFEFEERTARLKGIIEQAGAAIRVAGDVPAILEKEGLRPEGLTGAGLDFVRRKLEDGAMYYLVNHTSNRVDGPVALASEARSVVIMDPLTGKAGKARTVSGKRGTDVILQVDPGDALILRTFNREAELAEWVYLAEAGDEKEIKGTWDLEFLEGGPTIPPSANLENLQSWTGLSEEAKAFSGTARYTVSFENPDPEVKSWKLQLGDVRESARIRLNGEELGCLWSNPFRMAPLTLNEGSNRLEITVTNLSANRLRELEISGKEWKIFYEINIVNRHYEAFDATVWDPMPSGLLGPVSLVPLKELND